MTQPQFTPSFCPDRNGAPLFVTSLGNVVSAWEKQNIEANWSEYQANKASDGRLKRVVEGLRGVRESL